MSLITRQSPDSFRCGRAEEKGRSTTKDGAEQDAGESKNRCTSNWGGEKSMENTSASPTSVLQTRWKLVRPQLKWRSGQSDHEKIDANAILTTPCNQTTLPIYKKYRPLCVCLTTLKSQLCVHRVWSRKRTDAEKVSKKKKRPLPVVNKQKISKFCFLLVSPLIIWLICSDSGESTTQSVYTHNR